MVNNHHDSVKNRELKYHDAAPPKEFHFFPSISSLLTQFCLLWTLNLGTFLNFTKKKHLMSHAKLRLRIKSENCRMMMSYLKIHST